MTRSLNPVVVVGGGSTGHGLARSLGRRGIAVHVISHRGDPAAYSRYFVRRFTIDKERYDRLALKRALKEISKEFSKRGVVYPTSDLDALNLAKLKEELPDDYYFVVGGEEAVRTLVDKRKFYEELSKNDIVHPQTYFPDDLMDAQLLGAKLDYPVFIRPSITQLFAEAFPRHGKGFLAHTSRELGYYYRLAKRNGIDVMFQEVIPGPPSNSYQLEGYYNENHISLAMFARQRLRIWPPGFGNTTLCRSIPMKTLTEQRRSIDNFIANIGYHGLVSAEFKMDERNEEMRLLEINARPWTHFWLSERCGVNIAFASYMDSIGEGGVPLLSNRYEIGVKSMVLSADIRAALTLIWNKKLGFREWASSLRGVRCFAFLSRDDMSPFIFASLTQGYTLLKILLSKRYPDIAA
ncbi:MAG: hypothetical protein ACFFER_02530 [Candidatus Thorarchaeota archaeon]